MPRSLATASPILPAISDAHALAFADPRFVELSVFGIRADYDIR